jgi:5-methylcytosine-specific restriction endonuclease McrA
VLFHRTVPSVLYADYTRFRPLLRQDFRFRCAYCLTHEFYVGGEAGCEIDHHRPQNGPFARPDLVNVYENLFWCCRECNQNKGDAWPTPDEYAAGRRFLDLCRPEDDHDLHWQTHPDGVLEALSPTGE